MKKIIIVAGARPNFMKIAPILRELDSRDSVHAVLVHTGQHYDDHMSDSFFSSLGIRAPDYSLKVGSASHAVQTASIMVEFEQVCIKEEPDIVIVVGDVNSTVAAGLVAKKMHIKLAHVEAGLRSGDRNMPEEINRLATDAISDLFFTTEEEGTSNLLEEGQNPSSVHFVGHVMIDNLFYQLNKLDGKAPSGQAGRIKSLLGNNYICVTMHRPSNVDDENTLTSLVNTLHELSMEFPLLFPCHPRTFQRLEQFGLINMFQQIPANGAQCLNSGMFITEPLSYDDFLYIWKDATVVVTDSGGLQEETTALHIPCITMRNNTERPVTVEIGTNVVLGTDRERILSYGKKALLGQWKHGEIPPLWDGRASKRIVDLLVPG